MSANAWLIIGIVGFSLSGVALITAVILFIRLNIPAIIGDLTGRTVAREIKAIRNTNASGGDKRFRPSAVNLERGKLTEKVVTGYSSKMAVAHASKRLDKTSGEPGKSTAKKKTGTVGLSNAVQNGAVQSSAASSGFFEIKNTGAFNTDSTEVLSDNATEVLNDNSTEILSDNTATLSEINATAVLSDSGEAAFDDTTVLSSTEKLKDEKTPMPVGFKIRHNEVVIHSDEVIE